ncbi:MAG: transcription termination/antitermination protein NusG [Bacteroidota bacterium]
MKSESKWYVLKVASGQEKTAKKYFETELERQQLENCVTRVLIPSEKVYEIRAGKKRIRERNFLPGYILICADLSDKRVLHVVKDVPNALGFLGARGWGVGKDPVPLREKEVIKILYKVDEGETATSALEKPFIVGESVKIIDGPFSGFSGSIQEIFEERKKLDVTVRIFERNTPIELNYVQVEKLM